MHTATADSSVLNENASSVEVHTLNVTFPSNATESLKKRTLQFEIPENK